MSKQLRFLALRTYIYTNCGKMFRDKRGRAHTTVASVGVHWGV